MIVGVGAKVKKMDRECVGAELEPPLGRPGLQFLRKIDGRDNNAFPGSPAALSFTGGRPESCGRAIVEAVTTSIPVLAFPHDSGSEIVAEGFTGRTAGREAEFLFSPRRPLLLPHPAARRRFEEKFRAARIAGDDLGVHHELLETRQRLARDSAVTNYLELAFGSGLIAHVE